MATVTGFEKSKEQYAEYINCANEFKERLIKAGFEVAVSDDIQLAATYIVSSLDKTIGRISWNVPYYIEFEAYIPQREKSFSVDYVKNINDWREFLGDIEDSIIDCNNLTSQNN